MSATPDNLPQRERAGRLDQQGRAAQAEQPIEAQQDALAGEARELERLKGELADLAGVLACRRAALDAEQYDLKTQQQALQRQYAEQAERLRRRLEDLERRQAALDEQARAQADREQTVRREESKLAENLRAYRIDERQLDRKLEGLKKQQADLEASTRQLADRNDELLAREGQIVSQWQAISQAKTNVSAEMRRLSRQRVKAYPDRRGVVVKEAPVGRVRRWVVPVVVAVTAGLLGVALASIYLARPARFLASGKLKLEAAGVGNLSAAQVAAEEFHRFAGEVFPAGSCLRQAVEEGGAQVEAIDGPGWRALFGPPGGGPATRVTVRIQARTASAESAVGLVNRLIDGYDRWRDGKLRSIGASAAALEERQFTLDKKAGALRSMVSQAAGELAARAGPAGTAAGSPDNLSASLDAALAAMRKQLVEAEAARLKLAGELASWREELSRLGVAAEPVIAGPLDSMERSLEADRAMLADREARMSELRRQADAQLKAAQADWAAASRELLALLTRAGDVPLDDAAVKAAGRRFVRSQRACEEAADESRNVELATLQRTVAELRTRVADQDRLVTAAQAARQHRDRTGELNRLIADGQAQLDGLRERIQRLSADGLELEGRRQAWANLARELTAAETQLEDIHTRLAGAGLSAARIVMDPDRAALEGVVRDDPRWGWMLLAAGVVLLLGTALGWLLQLRFLRIHAGPAGQTSTVPDAPTDGTVAGADPPADPQAPPDSTLVPPAVGLAGAGEK